MLRTVDTIYNQRLALLSRYSQPSAEERNCTDSQLVTVSLDVSSQVFVGTPVSTEERARARLGPGEGFLEKQHQLQLVS